MEYMASLLPMAVGSVDRLEEITDRVRFVFAYDAASALAKPEIAAVLHEPGAREVIAALAAEITGPLLDREGEVEPPAAPDLEGRQPGQVGRDGCALGEPQAEAAVDGFPARRANGDSASRARGEAPPRERAATRRATR